MDMTKQMILEQLQRAGISYEIVEHPAVFTIDEMLALHLPHAESIAKNLFVRDDKKRQYYLICVREDKRVDLKALQTTIASRKLSFASEPDLNHILGLQKGSVTPLGLLHDDTHRVKMLLDKSFDGDLIGVHPGENTATIWMNTADLVLFLEQNGCNVEWIDL